MSNVSNTSECSPLVPISSDHFYTISILGTLLATMSIGENIFAFYVYISHVRYRKSYIMYLIFLAFCDFLISFIYFPLILVDKVKEYFVSLTSVTEVWLSYFGPLLMLAHVLKTWSAYLILAVTVERFFVQKQSYRYKSFANWLQQERLVIALVGLVVALLLKGPVAVEIEPFHIPGCPPGTQTHTVRGRTFLTDYYYGTIYRFYIRNIFSVFIPFIMLSYFNMAIVYDLRRNIQYPNLCTRQTRQRAIQTATRTTVSVVCTYLASNLLNVVLTAWEYIDVESLLINYRPFYAISADLVSLLTIIGCALRLPIYLTYDRVMRKSFLALNNNGETEYGIVTLNTDVRSLKNSDEKLDERYTRSNNISENDVFL